MKPSVPIFVPVSCWNDLAVAVAEENNHVTSVPDVFFASVTECSVCCG